MTNCGLSVIRVLVIDDNDQMRTIVGTVLSAAGIRYLKYAQDGSKGLGAVAEFAPDICFVDYEMPVMNGLEFIAAVRSLPSGDRCLPIIMLSGHTEYSRILDARDRGVTSFLSKPVTARDILRHLEAAIIQPQTFVETAAPGCTPPIRWSGGTGR